MMPCPLSPSRFRSECGCGLSVVVHVHRGLSHMVASGIGAEGFLEPLVRRLAAGSAPEPSQAPPVRDAEESAHADQHGAAPAPGSPGSASTKGTVPAASAAALACQLPAGMRERFTTETYLSD